MTSDTFILKSGRCSWGKCVFCGYGKIEGYEPSLENIKRDVDRFFSRLKNDVDELKIFGSGSFIDDKQFPKIARRYLLDKCTERKISKITFESRPEYVTADMVKEFDGFDFTVAFGLEIADDKILSKLKKGSTVAAFEKAASLVHKMKGKVRAYLLVNPPYVKDVKKSLNDSVNYALKNSDSVVLINLYPHFRAELMETWLSGKWKPLDKKQFDVIIKRWKSNKKVELDFETFTFMPKFENKKKITDVGEKGLTHPVFEVWQDYLQRFYNVPKGKDVVLFLPCAFRKPYSKSKTHKAILSRLTTLRFYPKIHQVMISNPGVIPREFENNYPFNAYDWREWEETPKIKKRYIEVTRLRLVAYLKSHSYKKVFAYFKPSSGSFVALKKACKDLNINLSSCLDDKTYKELSADSDVGVLTKRCALDGLLKKLRSEMNA